MLGPNVREMLLDNLSWLQAMEHYIEVWEQVERGSTEGASAVNGGHCRATMEGT